MGDVVGKPGVLAVRTLVPKLISRHSVDLVIANAENSEGGAGISPESAEAMLKAEVNLLTSGNHIWSKRQILPYLEQHPDRRTTRSARPAEARPSSARRTEESSASSTSRAACSCGLWTTRSPWEPRR